MIMRQIERLTTNMETNEDIVNVLVADNDPEFARLILEILARKGIRGHLAGDKAGVLDFISKNNCGLVFTGDSFSVKEGLQTRLNDCLELVLRIRENKPELPVVMIAG